MENLQMLLVKLWHIVEGTFRNIFKLYPEYSTNRLKICNNCPFKCYVPMMGYCCSKCGCVIKSKITIKEERCPVGKW